MTLPDPSTPIGEALEQLKLPPIGLVAVRTFGDLLVEVERGNVKDGDVLKAIGLKPAAALAEDIAEALSPGIVARRKGKADANE